MQCKESFKCQFPESFKNRKYLLIDMDSIRPLDLLNNARGKRVLISLKNNKQYSGVLKSFDVHVNLVLEEVEETDGEAKKNYGKIFIRGDTIVFISSE